MSPSTDVLADDPHRAGSLCVDPEGAIYVCEDRKGGRLHRHAVGEAIQVFASGLYRPHEIGFATEGSVYLAEQGRNRIFHFQYAPFLNWPP